MNRSAPNTIKNPGKPIAELCFQFLVWVTAKVEKFPRAHKFTVGDRLHATIIDVLMIVVEATYKKDRGSLLYQAQIKLEKSRFLFRLAVETRLINGDSYQYAARQIDEIGRSIGGWQKAQHAKTSRQAVSTGGNV